MRIVTNNVPRDILNGYELTDNEQLEFDWIENFDAYSFFRYRGNVYCLSEFMRYGGDNWDGCMADSYFSGILVRYCDNNERIVVASWYN